MWNKTAGPDYCRFYVWRLIACFVLLSSITVALTYSLPDGTIWSITAVLLGVAIGWFGIAALFPVWRAPSNDE